MAEPQAGPWYRTGHGETIAEVARGEETLTFDPPNVLFLAGQRLRVVDPQSDRPVMEVEQFDGTTRRYPMRVGQSRG